MPRPPDAVDIDTFLRAEREAMSEEDFQTQIKKLARAVGWMYYHTRDSRRSDLGFPDVVLVRPPRVIFVELKRCYKEPTYYQTMWLNALRQCPGVEAYLWFPTDIDAITDILAGDAS